MCVTPQCWVFTSLGGTTVCCLAVCAEIMPKRIWCVENYTGARCEEVFLPSSSIQTKNNLFAAFVALAVLVTLTIAALYFLCRKGHLQRASSAQCDVSVGEMSRTSAQHSHGEH